MEMQSGSTPSEGSAPSVPSRRMRRVSPPAWFLLLVVSLLLLLTAELLVSRVAAQGWYPIPSYAMRRDALGMAARAHAVTIIDQCKVTAAPRYYIWGGVASTTSSSWTPVTDGWWTSNGYDYTLWTGAYLGLEARIGASMVQWGYYGCAAGDKQYVFLTGGFRSMTMGTSSTTFSATCGSGPCAGVYRLDVNAPNSGWTLLSVSNPSGYTSRVFTPIVAGLGNIYFLQCGGLVSTTGVASSQCWVVRDIGTAPTVNLRWEPFTDDWGFVVSLPGAQGGTWGPVAIGFGLAAGAQGRIEVFLCGGHTGPLHAPSIFLGCFKFTACGATWGCTPGMVSVGSTQSTGQQWPFSRWMLPVVEWSGVSSTTLMQLNAATYATALFTTGDGMKTITGAGGTGGATTLRANVLQWDIWLRRSFTSLIADGGMTTRTAGTSETFPPTNVGFVGSQVFYVRMNNSVGVPLHCYVFNGGFTTMVLASAQMRNDMHMWCNADASAASTTTGIQAPLPSFLPPVANGNCPAVSSPASWWPGNRCRRSCASGWRLLDDPPSGWYYGTPTLETTGTPPECFKLPCTWLGPGWAMPFGVQAACASVPVDGNGGTCAFDLLSGYSTCPQSGSGNLVSTCQDGTWTPRAYPRVAKDCTIPSEVPQNTSAGTCTPNAVLKGCDANTCTRNMDASMYELAPGSGPLTLTCANGTLSAAPVVKPRDCIVAIPANSVLGSCTAAAGGGVGQMFVAHATSCSVDCNNGYTPSTGAATTACSYGTIAAPQICSPKPCPPLAPGTLLARNATVGTCIDIETNYRGHLSVCDLGCADGYTRDAGPQTTCLLGNFSLQTCTPTPCPYTNGANVASSTCPASIPSGTSCNVTCATGYETLQPATSCSFGVKTSQTCTPKPCAPLVGPDALLKLNATIGSCAGIDTTGLVHGTNCNLTCLDGYTRGGDKTRCALGILTLQTCTPSPCPYSFSAADNVSSSTCAASIPSGQSCAVTCVTGYETNGTATSCSFGKITKQTCVPAHCNVTLGLLASGNGQTGTGNALMGDCVGVNQTGVGRPHGSSCQLECMNGYTRFDDASTCNYGVWTPQRCAPSSCFAIAPENGGLGTCVNQYQDSVLAHGDTCIYTCDTGYYLNASTTGCAFGQLQPQLCLPHNCTAIKPANLPAQASLGDCSSTVGLLHGQSCQLQCADGWAKVKAATTCTLGVLDYQTCTPSSCPLVLPPLGSAGGCTDPMVNGQACNISCPTGYRTNVTQSLCTFGRLDAQSCIPKDCPPLPSLANATTGSCSTILSSGLLHGSACNITCASGFTRSAGPTTCSLGQLSLQQCTPSSCAVSIPSNGGMGGCPSVLPSAAQCGIQCNGGWVANATATRCDFGQLQAQACVPQACAPLSAAALKNFTDSSCKTSLLNGVGHGVHCPLQCLPGMTMTGTESSCAYGVVSLQSCAAWPCNLSPPSNGDIGDCPSVLPSGSSCQFGCAGGYVHNASATTCERGMVQPQGCEARSCTPLASLANATVGDCAGLLSTGVPNGFSCQIECLEGFTREGDATSCALGEVTVQTCRPSDCGVEAPANGNLGTCTGLLLNDNSCSFHCDDGFELNGTETRCSHGSLIRSQNCPGLPCPALGIEFLRARNTTEGSCVGIASAGVTHGTDCQLGCDAGYMLDPAPTAATSTQCTKGAYTSIQTCVPASCPIVVPPQALPGTCLSELNHGGVCSLTCRDPAAYSLNTFVSRCSYGVLTAQQDCLPRKCSALTVAALGNATAGTCTNITSPGLAHGTECQLDCFANYTRVGLNTSCAFGRLRLQTCAPNPCNVTQYVTSAFKARMGNCPDTLASGQSCQMSCDSGYGVTDSPAATSCSLGTLTGQKCDLLPCTSAAAMPFLSIRGVQAGSCPSTAPGGVAKVLNAASCNRTCLPDWRQTGAGGLSCSSGVFTQTSSISCRAPCELHLPSHSAQGTCPIPVPDGVTCALAPATGFVHNVASGYGLEITCNDGVMSPYPSFLAKDCAVSPPLHGRLGTCPSSMQSYTSCSFECDLGFVLSRSSTLCAIGSLYALQTCEMQISADDPSSPWTIVAIQVLLTPPDEQDQPIPASENVQISASLRWAKGTGSGSVTGADLTYQWRCKSHPSLNLHDPSVVLSPINSSILTLAGDHLPAPATLVFEIVMTDINPFHLTGDLTRPTASANCSVRVRAPVRLTVSPVLGADGAKLDPCLTAMNPCENGGVCSSAPDKFDATLVRMTCACPVSPFSFFGPTCAVGVLACPDCVSSFAGGNLISLYGLGFTSLVGIHLANTRVAYNPAKWIDKKESDVVENTLSRWGQPGQTALQLITFRSPPVTGNDSANLLPQSNQRRQLHSFKEDMDADAEEDENDGDSTTFSLHSFAHETVSFGSDPSGIVPSYVLLRLQTRPPLGSEVLNMNFTKLVYYTSSLCLEQGQWTDDGKGGCLSCPKGGFCPGGGRVWPLPGYWSYSEFQRPVECMVAESCLGVVANTVADSMSPSSGNQPYTNTANTCAEGYEGARCGQCAPQYYQQTGHCLFCGSESDQTDAVRLALLSAVVAMLVLSIGVAVLSAKALALTVTGFLVLQQLAIAGVDGSKNMPVYQHQFATAFVWLNMVNFDIELLRPGCAGLPTFTFIDKFMLTGAMFLIAAALFFLACLTRWGVNALCCAKRRRKVGPSAPSSVPAAAAGSALPASAAGDAEKGAATAPLAADSAEAARQRIAAVPLSAASNRGSVLQLMVASRSSSASTTLDFTERLQHAFLILLAMFYLRVALLNMKALQCEMGPDPSSPSDPTTPPTESMYLVADGQTLCYTGAHMNLVYVVFGLLFFYNIGFPLLCFIVLTRAFASPTSDGCIGCCVRNLPCCRGKATLVHAQVVKALEDAEAAEKGGHNGATSPTQAGANGGRTSTVGGRPSTQRQQSARWAERSLVQQLGGVVEDDEDDDDANGEADLTASKKLSEAEIAIAAELQRHREASYGFIFLGFKAEYYYFCLQVFLVQCFYAAVSVSVRDDGTDSSSNSVLKLFLLGLMCAGQALVVAVQQPYILWRENFTKLALSLAQLGHAGFMLAAQDQGFESTFFYAIALIFGLILFILLFRGKCPCLSSDFDPARTAQMKALEEAERQRQAGGAGAGGGVAGDEEEDDDEDSNEAEGLEMARHPSSRMRQQQQSQMRTKNRAGAAGGGAGGAGAAYTIRRGPGGAMTMVRTGGAAASAAAAGSIAGGAPRSRGTSVDGSPPMKPHRERREKRSHRRPGDEQEEGEEGQQRLRADSDQHDSAYDSALGAGHTPDTVTAMALAAASSPSFVFRLPTAQAALMQQQAAGGSPGLMALPPPAIGAATADGAAGSAGHFVFRLPSAAAAPAVQASAPSIPASPSASPSMSPVAAATAPSPSSRATARPSPLRSPTSVSVAVNSSSPSGGPVASPKIGGVAAFSRYAKQQAARRAVGAPPLTPLGPRGSNASLRAAAAAVASDVAPSPSRVQSPPQIATFDEEGTGGEDGGEDDGDVNAPLPGTIEEEEADTAAAGALEAEAEAPAPAPAAAAAQPAAAAADGDIASQSPPEAN